MRSSPCSAPTSRAPPARRCSSIASPVRVLGSTATQVNWVAPDLGGTRQYPGAVLLRRRLSAPYAMPVAPVAPGIFTADGKQVAAYNAGYTLNGPAIPIARGQVIMLFGTGFGPLAARMPTACSSIPSR